MYAQAVVIAVVSLTVTGLELRRDLFYRKELSFQVSCSYGPGRYDPAYEQQCQDYPIGFVRWTENRNFQAVLHALATGALRTDPLVSHRFPIEQSAAAYELLSSPQPSLGILLQYPGTAFPEQRSVALQPETVSSDSRAVLPDQPLLGVIGAGNYSCRCHRLRKGWCFLPHPSALSGVGPVQVGRKFGCEASTDVCAWTIPAATLW